MILSASRRTDIPCYYSEWFMNRLKEGYVLTRNPMNLSQVSRVSLSPETVDCIVFWTKDPADMMDKLPQLDALGYHYYFQYTLTPYGQDIERNLRDKNDIVKTFQQLSQYLGKNRVLWRYDPIILNNELTAEYHIDHFRALCEQLYGYTDVCTVSFVDVYNKLNRQVRDNLIRTVSDEEMHQLASVLSEIGRKHGIELRACCEKLDFSRDGVIPAACIDKELVEQVSGHAVKEKNDRNQRMGCGCLQSIDIGVYNTCGNGCVYCYANHSDTSINRNRKRHDPGSDILIGTVED